MFKRKCALTSCCQVTRPCSKTSVSTCRRRRLLKRCRSRSFVPAKFDWHRSQSVPGRRRLFTSKCALTSCCQVTRPCSKTSMSACRRHRLSYRCRSRSFVCGMDKQAHFTLGGTSVRRGATWTIFRLFFPGASGRCNKSDVRVRSAGRTSDLRQSRSHFD